MEKIGIIGAMELEVSTLKEAMAVSSVITCAGMDFYEGTLMTLLSLSSVPA